MKLLNPQMKQIQLHHKLAQQHANISNNLEYLLPSLHKHILQDAKIFETYLKAHPMLAIASENNDYHIVSQTISFHLARLCLPDNKRIMIIVADSLTDDEIDQLIITECLISPIINNAQNKDEIIWKIKQHFERSGLLASFNLDKIPKKIWAELLCCDQRKLSNENATIET